MFKKILASAGIIGGGVLSLLFAYAYGIAEAWAPEDEKSYVCKCVEQGIEMADDYFN